MNILDLNHIEAVEGNEVVGGRFKGTFFNKNANINVNENIKINKKLNSKVNVKGNFAFAEADADAFGKDTVAEAITYTITDSFYSGAVAQSVSGTN